MAEGVVDPPKTDPTTEGKPPSQEKPEKPPSQEKPEKPPSQEKPEKPPGQEKPEKPPSEEKPEKPPTEEKPETAPEDPKPPSEETTPPQTIFDILKDKWNSIVNNPYRMKVLFCAMLFVFALEMARELKHIAIPMFLYRPFRKVSECLKCLLTVIFDGVDVFLDSDSLILLQTGKMFNLLLNNKPIIVIKDDITLHKIQLHIHHTLFLDSSEYYLLQNGKRINTDTIIKPESIDIILRTCGGKGGFGSMLRAIGAQIEKTTNREACRDLSGRRLRDINEEKRLKKWIAQQAEREKEAVERRHKKLEKLCEQPKHQFQDKEYDNERTLLPEIVENAVTQGLRASCSNTTHKRKRSEPEDHKKKRKLW
ncbi:splicing factor sf3a-related [Holotrichia oblita]|uniref:Splicing factor sf3a-related n=1 Tax=Holotrichia oblita TaxID=644536 RepID=A0ACB9TNH7_HOLOL|nr:splicing factor sf3a-related [Holotrichia oblita]